MPNRIIRGELLDSEAWLALKDNADRSAWLACFLTVDNFGNMPAGPYRLMRLWRPYGIDDPAKVAKTFSDLLDVDLLRRYEADYKPYLHIPRFRQELRYPGTHWPLSPWTTEQQKQLLNKKSRVIHEQSPVLHRESPNDVDVDVDVDEVRLDVAVVPVRPKLRSPSAASDGRKRLATRLPPDWQLPDDWKAWAVAVHHLEAQRVVRISLSFRDFWIAKSGANATKLDWQATWRNWIRRETGNA